MAKYVAPAGTIIRGWTVALEPTPEQAGKFRRDCGARRFACNWAVAQIKEAFDRGAETGEHDNSVWFGWCVGAVGVDVGIGNDLLIVMRPDGTVAEKVPVPDFRAGALWSVHQRRTGGAGNDRRRRSRPRPEP